MCGLYMAVLAAGGAGDLENELVRAQREVELHGGTCRMARHHGRAKAQKRLDEATKKEAPKWCMPQAPIATQLLVTNHLGPERSA